MIVEANAKGEKEYFIEGVFMQAEVKNRNGRVYPKAIMANEVKRYTKEFVDKSRAFGELGHPDGPTINLDKLGVSSRGLGSLEQKGDAQVVKGDFQLATAADIVADPSAPEAFVEGIMEGVEWIYDNGILKARDVEQMKKELSSATLNKLEETKLNLWKRFVENL